MHSARTTARQLPESRLDAIVVLLVVRLAVVHDVSGASAQPSAAERRLMLWPIGCEKGLHSPFPSDPLVIQSCRQHKMCVKSRDKHNGTFASPASPRYPTVPQHLYILYVRGTSTPVGLLKASLPRATAAPELATVCDKGGLSPAGGARPGEAFNVA